MSQEDATLTNDDVWVLVPVHNRKEITLTCLDHLSEFEDFKRLNVVVIDDGSTDGTAKAVQKGYPEVSLLRGDGSLWWGGAIRAGMKYAFQKGAKTIVWLNDDVRPDEGAVTALAQCAFENTAVLAGVVSNGVDSDYTTRLARTRWGVESMEYKRDEEIQSCDLTPGKFVAIPREVIEKIGLPDTDAFPHHICDYEYTLRAAENGFEVGVYSPASAEDIAFEPATPRLSSEVSFETVFLNTFNPGAHSSYTLRMNYYRDLRFTGPPRAVGYLVFLYHCLRSLGAVIIKLALALGSTQHSLRSQ
ncbi:glycosyltransferase family 2 protein [Haloglomus halophilum]|uniref:glycosyltransferase family 2 protein n=1 Tax=Haloglomus halophilum TaxID=2962672 RepID=UPI0020C9C022|nr:glycosyltransferase family 2 protein [Haloglomus halophilum]